MTFPYKGVIFDMDGTLVDTEVAYMKEEQDFFHDMGVEVPLEELFKGIGSSYDNYLQEIADRLLPVKGPLTHAEAEALFGAWSENVKTDYASLLNPGVKETLAELREMGVKVALASSTAPEGIQEVLDACGLQNAFDSVLSGEECEHGKPAPDVYLLSCERLGLRPSECCCVEDSATGIASGKAAGLTVYAKREARFGFSQEQADFIIEQIPDLLKA